MIQLDPSSFCKQNFAGLFVLSRAKAREDKRKAAAIKNPDGKPAAAARKSINGCRDPD
jgi:hypothetical protein